MLKIEQLAAGYGNIQALKNIDAAGRLQNGLAPADVALFRHVLEKMNTQNLSPAITSLGARLINELRVFDHNAQTYLP